MNKLIQPSVVNPKFMAQFQVPNRRSFDSDWREKRANPRSG
jgi:hypothetical protein